VDVGGRLRSHVAHREPTTTLPRSTRTAGASTGIGGGAKATSLSVASRPIAPSWAILRFGLIDKSGHLGRLLKTVVRGIGDYGNCVGVPTVAGRV